MYNNQLLRKQITQHTTLLIIPIIDEDATVISKKEGDVIGDFCYDYLTNYINDSVCAYAAYIRAFIKIEQTTSMVFSMHNIECNEGPVISSPVIQKSGCNTDLLDYYNNGMVPYRRLTRERATNHRF